MPRRRLPPPTPAALLAPLGLQAISAAVPFATCCLVSSRRSSQASLVNPLIKVEDAVALAHALELQEKRESGVGMVLVVAGVRSRTGCAGPAAACCQSV